MDSSSFTLNSRAYDALKWIALVLLPSLGTLYFGLGQIWHFPTIEEVVGSIVVLDTFLGVLINKSSKNYKELMDYPVFQGDIVVSQDVEGAVEGMRLVAHQDPMILPDGKLVAFMVKREQAE